MAHPPLSLLYNNSDEKAIKNQNSSYSEAIKLKTRSDIYSKEAAELRHLIYSGTTIKKTEYLNSAGVIHGIDIRYENGIMEITLPCLFPKREQRQSTEFLTDPLYFAINRYIDANVATNHLKSEVTRRLRLHRIAETFVTMQNADVNIFRDKKPDVFYPPGYEVGDLAIYTPAFYSSREIKEVGTETVKISGARAVGTLLTPDKVFIV